MVGIRDGPPRLRNVHGDWVDPGFASLPRQTVDTWLAGRGERPRKIGDGGPRRLLEMLRSYRKALAFFGECTYSGAPAGASPEIGERILDTLGERAAEACSEILDGTIGPDDCHSPVWKIRFLFLNPLMIRLSHLALGFRNGVA